MFMIFLSVDISQYVCPVRSFIWVDVGVNLLKTLRIWRVSAQRLPLCHISSWRHGRVDA